MVRRRPNQRIAELPGSSPRLPSAEQGRDCLGGRTGRPAGADVSDGVAGGKSVRQRVEAPRGQARRPRDDLSAGDPRASDRHAGVRSNRSDSQRDLCRIQRESDSGPSGGLSQRGDHHRGRRISTRQRCSLEEDGGRSGGGPAVRAPCRRLSTDERAGVDEEGPRRLVARGDLGRRRLLRARADGGHGPALRVVHLRDDRPAQRCPPFDGRLSRRRRDDPSADLRREGSGPVLVHRGHRLGHRPHVHRLRPARERRDVVPVRGRAGLASTGPVLVDHRVVRCHDPVYRAHGDPRVHALGRRVAEETRPVDPPPPRDRRRTDQSGGVAMVSQDDRRRSLSDRRHVVADGDRHDPAHAAPRPDDAEAGIRDPPLPRHRRGGRR